MTLRRDVEYDNRGRLVSVTDYGRAATAKRTPTPRRNEMPPKPPGLTPDQKHRLEAVEKDMKDVSRATRRRLAEPIVEAAVTDGRIDAGDQARWMERVDTFGVDTVRDLLLERRPSRQLAAANAAAAQPEFTDAQKTELAVAFGLRPEDL